MISLIRSIRDALTDPRLGGKSALFILAAVALATATYFRLTFPVFPLSQDESFTGAIAAEPSLWDAMKMSLNDPNAPGFFLLEHVWASIFPLSNASLRTPALIAGLIAPILCLIPTPGLSWRAQFLWCAVVALWPYTVMYSLNARCYSTLYFLAVANTLAFIRLTADDRPRNAFLWGTTAAAMIFFHYFALFLIAAQTLVQLWRRRVDVLRLWPAAFPLAIPAAWLLMHLPFLLEARGVRSDSVSLSMYPSAFVFTFGGAFIVSVAVGMAIPLRLLRGDGLKFDETAGISGRGPWLAVAAGAGALLLFLAANVPHAIRYLFSFAPACLLLPPLVCERFSARLITAPAFVLAAMIGLGWTVPLEIPDWFVTELETGSEFLMKSGVRRVGFFWDTPLNAVTSQELLRKVAGFCFKRAGAEVVVTSYRFPEGVDPNVELQRLAPDPQSGFIWFYEERMQHTAAGAYTPRLADLSKNFECRQSGLGFDEGQLLSGALACIRKKEER